MESQHNGKQVKMVAPLKTNGFKKLKRPIDFSNLPNLRVKTIIIILVLTGLRLLADHVYALIPSSWQQGACVEPGLGAFSTCFAKTGMDEKLHQDVKIFWGADEYMADRACSNVDEAITCINNVISRCQEAEQYLDVAGYNANSIRTALTRACEKIEDYKRGIPCFGRNSESLESCYETHSAAEMGLSVRNSRGDLTLLEMYRQTCPSIVKMLRCMVGVVESECKDESLTEMVRDALYTRVGDTCAVATGLRNEDGSSNGRKTYSSVQLSLSALLLYLTILL